MSNTPSPASEATALQPDPKTILLIHGNWYALEESGALLSGPILVGGKPALEDGGLVDFERAGFSKKYEFGLREVERTLRWIRVAGIEGDLTP